MSKIRMIAAFIILMSMKGFAQDAKTIKPKISDVTVFLSGAQVTQTGEISLKAGENHLKISDLTIYMDPNSIQVEGSKDYTIISVRHQVNYLNDQSSNPKVKAILDSLDDAQFRLEEIQAMSEVYNDEIQLLHSNYNMKGQDDQLLPEDLGEMANFYRNRLKEIKYKQLELNQSTTKLNEQIQRLQIQLNNLNAKKGQTPSEIYLTINSPREMKSDLKVSYVVRNAGWIPFYDLRAEDINSNIEFSYRAKVYQSTGTDWEDVMLTISTGNPTTGGQVPDMYPWYINLYDPQPIRKREEVYLYDNNGNAPASAPMVMEKNNADASGETFMWTGATTAQYTTVENSGVAAEFKISIPYDIPSDNQQYDVLMQKQSFKASYQYITIPKLDNDAFLSARVTDWMQYALLPGESNIYFKGTFVGKGFIDPAMAIDTLQLSLGRDKAIQVKREQVKDFCKTGLFGSTQQTTKAFEITITNTKKQAIEIEIEDQIPISQNGELEVSAEELNGGTLDPETGKIVWKQTIQAGETIKKQLRFSVKYPKKKLISNF